MIYCMSDIHGYFVLLKERTEQILGIMKENDKLIFLGDYIDRGKQSCQCVEYLFELQDDHPNNVILLKGNHDEWFCDFVLGRNNDLWLIEDKKMLTSGTFMTTEQIHDVKLTYLTKGKPASYALMKKTIQENHAELIKRLSQLPLYYETENQIFVHAGIDEEAGEFWKTGTDDRTFVFKYPAQKGRFYKDIIAGHIGANEVRGDMKNYDIYYDGQSHYYIDPSVYFSGRLNVLVYDDTTGKYYSLNEDGGLSEVVSG